MRILFGQGVPGGLTASLRSHDVTEARKLNWEKVANGALLRLAEDAGYISGSFAEVASRVRPAVAATFQSPHHHRSILRARPVESLS